MESEKKMENHKSRGTTPEQISRARDLRVEGKLSEALILLKDYCSTLDITKNSELLVCHNELSQCLWRLGKLPEAEKYALSALNLSRQEPSDFTGEAKALHNLGEIRAYEGNFEESQQFHEQSLQIRERIGEPCETSTSLNSLAIIFAQKGEFTQAKGLQKQALKLSEQIKDFKGIHQCLNNLGIISWKLGKLDQAVDFHKRAITLLERENIPQQIGYSLGNLGNLYLQKGELDEAEAYFQKALQSFEETEDFPIEKALTISNIGNVYLTRGNLEKAEQYQRLGLTLFRERGNPNDITWAIYNLTQTLLTSGQFQEAETYVYELSKAKEVQNQPIVDARYYLSKTLLKLKQNDLGSALELADKAREIASRITNFQLEIRAIQFKLQTLLRIFLLDKLPEHRTKIEQLVKELEEISKRERLYGTYIETLIVGALLKRASFQVQEAIKQFEIAEHLARERGIGPLEERAREEIQTLQEQVSFFHRLQESHPSIYENAQIERVLSYLDEIQVFFKDSKDLTKKSIHR